MIKHLIYSFLAVFCLMVILCWKSIDTTVPPIPQREITTVPPECVRLFYAIEKYAVKYDIPLKYAYGIAYKETRYAGPFQWEYDAKLTSPAGALGPMQVMYTTAKFCFPDTTFSKERVRDDLEFNVECSMKLTRYLYDRYGNWPIVFGNYNTGRPLINDYATFVYNYDPKTKFVKNK